MNAKQNFRIIRWVLVLLLVGALGWVCTDLANALRICRHCGHEALGEEAACGHCGAELPPAPGEASPVAEEPEEDPPEDDPFDGQSVARVAAAQARRSEALEEQGVWVGALLYARNARALTALSDPHAIVRDTELARRSTRARERLEAVQVRCPLCEGSGHSRTWMMTMQGERVEQDVVGSDCALCRGRGTLAGRRPAAAVQRLFIEGGRAFEHEQRERGLERRLGIWMPDIDIDAIPPRRLAGMLQAFELVCETCRGLGHSGCIRCEGTGALRCPNSGCLHGTETCPDCEGQGRAQGRRCETCNGTGRRICAECGARGFIPCTDCEGEGNRLCRTCRGAGRPAVCSRCDGSGVDSCSRCRGVGEWRGVECPQCRGETVVLCPTCGGYGRGRSRRR